MCCERACAKVSKYSRKIACMELRIGTNFVQRRGQIKLLDEPGYFEGLLLSLPPGIEIFTHRTLPVNSTKPPLRQLPRMRLGSTSGFRRAPLAARRSASRCSVARTLELHGHDILQTATTGHSITRSVRSIMDCGIRRPSVLAVLRLIPSSSLVTCSIGNSAGFAPFRIRSTNEAALEKLARKSGP